MISDLKDLGFQCESSQSNFLLVTVPHELGVGAEMVYESLREKGIFIRYFGGDRLDDKIRITIGTPNENDKLLSVLKGLL